AVNNIAGTYAGFCRGRTGHGSQHDRMIFLGADVHPYAVVFSALIFTQKRVLAWVEKSGMRIEHPQHSGNGTLVERVVGVYGKRILLLDDGENLGETLNGVLQIGRSRGGSTHRWPVDAT